MREEEIKKQRKNHKSEFTISSKDVLDMEDNSEIVSQSEEEEEEVEQSNGESEAITYLRTPD